MNLGPTGYEPVALTAELWARVRSKKYTEPVAGMQGRNSSDEILRGEMRLRMEAAVVEMSLKGS